MKECLKEQKEVEQKLILADILLSDKTIEQYKQELEAHEDGIEKTLLDKQKILKELKI